MKPIARQLIVAALVLVFVTVVSLGIRHIRFSLHRAHTVENSVITEAEPVAYPADSQPEPGHAFESDVSIENEPDPKPVDTPVSEMEKSSNVYSKAKLFKGNNTKSKSSKGLEKISLSDDENLYRTKDGQLWYVSDQPDGKTVKMQVMIDEATGEIVIVDAKSAGSQNLQKISLGDYDNLYITETGEQWYVSDQPDGSGSKSRVHIDDTTGEITVLEDYVDNGRESASKD